jgi:hypothetical protein
MRALLPLSLLLWATFTYGQKDDVNSFMSADVHDYDLVNFTSLVPSLNIYLLSKSQGALPGSIVLESSQPCSFIPGTIKSLSCAPNGGLFASFAFIPQKMIGLYAQGASTTHICGQRIDIPTSVGADGITRTIVINV